MLAMAFPSSASLLVLDAFDNHTFFRVRSVAPAWASTAPNLCKRVLQIVVARIAGAVKNKMHENKNSRPQVELDIPLSHAIVEMCFQGHWNHDSDGLLLARFDGPWAILSAFPNLPLAVHPVPNDIPTTQRKKKLSTWFRPFNFKLMSHGGSEARPLARRVFNFDKNDLAQAPVHALGWPDFKVRLGSCFRHPARTASHEV